METDPLLIPDDTRFVVLPVKYQDLYQMYKNAVACFWTAEEVDLSKDLGDWERMTKDENLAVRFFNEVQNSEARLFYGFQMAIDCII